MNWLYIAVAFHVVIAVTFVSLLLYYNHKSNTVAVKVRGDIPNTTTTTSLTLSRSRYVVTFLVLSRSRYVETRAVTFLVPVKVRGDIPNTVAVKVRGDIPNTTTTTSLTLSRSRYVVTFLILLQPQV